SGEARVVAAPMPVGVERRHQVAGRAAGGIGKATLPRLPECGEPAEEHLPRVEHGGGFRRADHPAAHCPRWQLNLDLPTGGALGASREIGTSQTPGSTIQRWDDV